MMYRQGDVLLKKIDKMPCGLKEKNRTLAFGEVTGHHHTLQTGRVMVATDGTQYVELVEDTVLEHQDHAHITIPKGVYEVRLQREYDVVEGVRQVLD